MTTKLPGWVNDPAQFIEAVHSVWGKRDNNEALRTEMAALRAEIDRMRPKPEPRFITDVEFELVEEPPRQAKPKAEEPKQEVGIIEPEVLPEVIPKKEEVPVEVYQLLAQLAQLSQLTQIKEKLEKEEFEGKLDPRTLDATDSLKWLDLIEGPPHKPWITAYFINDGPNSVEVGVNHPELKRQEIKLDETLTINQEHAKERIRRLFYKCDTSETASVRVVGQY